jgi:hypothetical protein
MRCYFTLPNTVLTMSEYSIAMTPYVGRITSNQTLTNTFLQNFPAAVLAAAKFVIRTQYFLAPFN